MGTRTPLTAFGQVSTAIETPSVQLDAMYGITTDLESEVTGTGSVAGTEAAVFEVATGTTALSTATLQSYRDCRYRPGQGSVARWTAGFPSGGVEQSFQLAGVFSPENALGFGFNGTEFGILRRTAGALEIQAVTITAAAVAGQNLTITLDGTAYVTAITAGAAEHVAFQIAQNSAFLAGGWRVAARGAALSFVSKVPGDRVGVFSVSSTGSVTATITQARQGKDPEDNWTPQSKWNRDKVPWLDPTKINIFSVRWQWLGVGAIVFYVEVPYTGELIAIHQVRHANANVVPTVRNPTFKIGWQAKSLGSTTNLKVLGISAMIAVEGVLVPRRLSRAVETTKASISTEQAILSIRNSEIFANRFNFREVVPLRISVGSEGNGSAPVTIRVYRNATLTGVAGVSDEPRWAAVDASNSCVDLDIAAETASGGNLVAALALSRTGQAILDLSILPLFTGAGDTLTITGATSSGTVTLSCSLSWYED